MECASRWVHLQPLAHHTLQFPIDLDAPVGPMRLTKRDAHRYADKLQIPAPLTPYFGRPPVRAGSLMMHAGLSLDDLTDLLGAGGPMSATSILHPVSLSWPLGLSWSSFLAQSWSLWCCKDAGLTADSVLSDDLLARRSGVACAPVADDVMIFFGSGESEAGSWCAHLDTGMG